MRPQRRRYGRTWTCAGRAGIVLALALLGLLPVLGGRAGTAGDFGHSVPVASPPNPSLALVAERAEEQIRHGFKLAEKGALYSAEASFTQALMLIAGALDAHDRTRAHTEALAAGLTALDEADDFAPSAPASLEPRRLADLIAAHRTPVLKKADLTQLTPLLALQDYYRFAVQKLTEAAGRQPAAAMALYGLGRAQLVPPIGTAIERTLPGPKALALHRAALAVDPGNHLAANEMGALLARFGQYEEARLRFEQSLAMAETPEARKNLEAVRRRLGLADSQAADRARHAGLETNDQGRKQPPAAAPEIRWVDHETFAASAAADPTLVVPGSSAVPQQARAATDANGTLFKSPLQTLRSSWSKWRNDRPSREQR